MLIDAHVHLDKFSDEEIGPTLDAIHRGPFATMSVSVDVASFHRGRALASGSPLIVQGFGIHPEFAGDFVDRLDELDGLVDEAPFIGEVGLDHRFVEDATRYPAQNEVFDWFLHRAAESGKLVNLHCSGAEAETAAMLRSHELERMVVHWYAGPLAVLDEMVRDGCCFTVGVEVLASDHIRSVAAAIPMDQLLLETDNPGGKAWLTGSRGVPSDLEAVAAAVAEVKGTSVPQLEAAVARTMRRLCEGDPGLAGWVAQVA